MKSGRRFLKSTADIRHHSVATFKAHHTETTLLQQDASILESFDKRTRSGREGQKPEKRNLKLHRSKHALHRRECCQLLITMKAKGAQYMGKLRLMKGFLQDVSNRRQTWKERTPDVHCQQRGLAPGKRILCIWRFGDCNFIAFLHKPGPSTVQPEKLVR